MVVANREEAYLALTNALRLRHVKRVYHAILWGDPRYVLEVLQYALLPALALGPVVEHLQMLSF